jgi:hypothetical protein
MKCFTVRIERQFVAASHDFPGFLQEMQRYPTAQDGIICTAEGVIELADDKRVLVAADFLEAGQKNGAVKCTHNGFQILRASPQIGKSGNFELIDEPQGGSPYALVLFDVGLGGSSRVVCRCDPLDIVARGLHDPLVGGPNEVLLATLAPGKSVVAERRSKRFIVFGKEQVDESITFLFDGKGIERSVS